MSLDSARYRLLERLVSSGLEEVRDITFALAVRLIEGDIRSNVAAVLDEGGELAAEINALVLRNLFEDMVVSGEVDYNVIFDALEADEYGYLTFKAFIDKMEYLDWYGLVKSNYEVTGEFDLLLPVRAELEFGEAFRRAFRVDKRHFLNQDDYREIGAGFARRYIEDHAVSDISSEPLNFTMAGVPRAFPVTEKFAAFVSEFYRDDTAPLFRGNPYEKFNLLRKVFADLAGEVYEHYDSRQYVALPTNGSGEAFMKLYNLHGNDKAVVIAGSNEYLGMMKGVEELIVHSGFDARYLDKRAGISRKSREKGFVASSYELQLDALLSQIPKELLNSGKRLMFVVSTVSRDGRKDLDVDPYIFERVVRSKFENYNCRVEVFFDASQDSQPVCNGDYTTHSKKLGGSGAGMLLVKAEKEDVIEGFGIPSGFNEAILAKNIAAMLCIKGKSPYRVSDLKDRPEAFAEPTWFHVVEAEREAAFNYVNFEVPDSLVSEHFDIDLRQVPLKKREIGGLGASNLVDMIVRFEPKSIFASTNIQRIREVLSHLGVEVDGEDYLRVTISTLAKRGSLTEMIKRLEEALHIIMAPVNPELRSKEVGFDVFLIKIDRPLVVSE